MYILPSNHVLGERIISRNIIKADRFYTVSTIGRSGSVAIVSSSMMSSIPLDVPVRISNKFQVTKSKSRNILNIFIFKVFPGFQKNFIGDEDIAYDLSIFRSLDYLEVRSLLILFIYIFMLLLLVCLCTNCPKTQSLHSW